MASNESKDGQNNKVTTHSAELTSSQEFDLDKNPIKYRTWDGKFSTQAHDKDYMELILRSGQHSDLVKKLIRQRIEARAKEFPRWPGDAAAGVRLMWIESRFWYDRERFLPDFDNEWRSYRAKYLHSLELDPREPVHVPEYEKMMINPIRRTYMKVGDWLEDNIMKKITNDKYKASVYRVNTTRTIMAYFAIVGFYYIIRYGYRRWDSPLGFEIHQSAPAVLINDKRFPMASPFTHPQQYYDMGFAKRTLYKDLREWEDNSVAL